MNVRQLIAMLEEQDPEAQVFLASQPGWPFEYSIHGVAVRSEMDGDAEDDGEDNADQARARASNGCAPSDVFIVEGSQLRYGSKAAWDTARRG
ncbi:MAG: hypothetical protein ACHREM_12755 [Polyangiales bacterium]